MKLKSLLLAGALAALPLAASAQQPPPQPSSNESTETKTTETKIVTTTGTVQSYEAGRSITITTDKGEQMTFNLTESSEVPKTIEVGKTVTIQTTTSSSGTPVVKTVTTTTTTTTTKKKPY